MGKENIQLDAPTRKVLLEICEHKAMPFLEIAAVTGIRGWQLKDSVKVLINQNLVAASNNDDLTNSIISISGSSLR